MNKYMVSTALSLFMAGSAFAGLLDIRYDEATVLSGALPLGASHDVNLTKGSTGWYNANLWATEDVILTYEFLGFEAGWTNTFVVDGSQVFWNRTGTTAGDGSFTASSVWDSASSSASAESLLDFGFDILIGGNAGYGVTNGLNNYPINTRNTATGLGMPNFFLGYADGTENSVYIALDDGGGTPWKNDESIDDDNHDDMVVKVTAVAVPEPESIVLLGLGLVGLGFVRYRSKKA